MAASTEPAYVRLVVADHPQSKVCLIGPDGTVHDITNQTKMVQTTLTAEGSHVMLVLDMPHHFDFPVDHLKIEQPRPEGLSKEAIAELFTNSDYSTSPADKVWNYLADVGLVAPEDG